MAEGKIAIIGASADRQKFGNKCVRAYKLKGFRVFPVNLNEDEIEGIVCYKSIKDVEKVDIVSIYLKPEITLTILDDIISAKPDIVYLNPGTENEQIEEKLTDNGIAVRKECSIIAIGINPGEL